MDAVLVHTGLINTGGAFLGLLLQPARLAGDGHQLRSGANGSTEAARSIKRQNARMVTPSAGPDVAASERAGAHAPKLAEGIYTGMLPNASVSAHALKDAE